MNEPLLIEGREGKKKGQKGLRVIVEDRREKPWKTKGFTVHGFIFQELCDKIYFFLDKLCYGGKVKLWKKKAKQKDDLLLMRRKIIPKKQLRTSKKV